MKCVLQSLPFPGRPERQGVGSKPSHCMSVVCAAAGERRRWSGPEVEVHVLSRLNKRRCDVAPDDPTLTAAKLSVVVPEAASKWSLAG